MKTEKILWLTDFSKSAEKALPYIQSITRQYGAQIHVFHVIKDISQHESWYGEFDKKRVVEQMNWAQKSATKHLDRVCEKYLEGCPFYLKHIAVGDPAREILKLIESA